MIDNVTCVILASAAALQLEALHELDLITFQSSKQGARLWVLKKCVANHLVQLLPSPHSFCCHDAFL